MHAHAQVMHKLSACASKLALVLGDECAASSRRLLAASDSAFFLGESTILAGRAARTRTSSARQASGLSFRRLEGALIPLFANNGAIIWTTLNNRRAPLFDPLFDEFCMFRVLFAQIMALFGQITEVWHYLSQIRNEIREVSPLFEGSRSQ